MRIAANLRTAVLMILVATGLLGVAYPLAVTACAQLLFPDSADGQLIVRNGRVIGSRLIGQPFSAPEYFHSRPSAAGPAGYDATASGGSNLGPTSAALVALVRARADAARREDGSGPVPIDLVTASASGLDPHITPANAAFQAARVARVRGVTPAIIERLIEAHTEGRQLGFLGEPRVNVLLLNLALDDRYPMRAAARSDSRPSAR
ncbi:MAG TPA: potassium-transporting ATPase subunit KdpC [Vicinamibacterales bacterium]|jgi:K+-transporting ATPase ATPase C chain